MSEPEVKKTKPLIKNIFHMLSYAFRTLKEPQYKRIATEQFDNVENLLAAILSKDVAQQIKQGLHREYVEKHETLPVIRGKLNLPDTIRNRIRRNPKAACEFDELSEDNLLNRILKTTMNELVRAREIDRKWKDALKKDLVYFDGVGELPVSRIPWDRVHFQKSNQHYKTLIGLCFSLLNKRLPSEESGGHPLPTFSFTDEELAVLYERFVYEYYKQEHTGLRTEFQEQVPWNVPDATDKKHLPVMKTDTMLRKGEKILIIDTKFYGQILKGSYPTASKKLSSDNLYQLFAYVKNKDAEATGNVSGLLLYAKTNEPESPKSDFNMNGNWIFVRTLDLNLDFVEIREQLDMIVEDCLMRPCPKTGNHGIPAS